MREHLIGGLHEREHCEQTCERDRTEQTCERERTEQTVSDGSMAAGAAVSGSTYASAIAV